MEKFVAREKLRIRKYEVAHVQNQDLPVANVFRSVQRLLCLRMRKERLSHHIFWECSEYLWIFFIQLWRKRNEMDFRSKYAIFSGEIAYLPKWETFTLNAEETETKNLLQRIWRLLTVSTFEFIWQTRNERVHRGEKQPRIITLKRFSNMLDRKIRQLATQMPEARTMVGKMRKELLFSQPIVTSETKYEVLAFFDGGSRNNPGIGAAGSWLLIYDIEKNSHQIVLVVTGPEQKVTNNEAEVLGFFQITNWIQNQFTNIGNISLKIYGDSNLLIKGINGEINIKRNSIQSLLDKILFQLEKFKKWSARHVFRKKNKLADYLANAGMDNLQSPSIQETEVLKFLENDLSEKSFNFYCPGTFTRSESVCYCNGMKLTVTQWKSSGIVNEKRIIPSIKEGVG